MKISLSHVTELIGYVDIHLNVSTADATDYFESLFNLGKETGRFMVVHVRKKRNADGTFEPDVVSIEGTIYDKDGEVAVVPKRLFREGDETVIKNWIIDKQNIWMKELKVKQIEQCNPQKLYLEIKNGQHGYFDDGRYYTVLSVPSIMMCTDGSLRWGDVEVRFDDEEMPYVMRISEFMEHVVTAGNLTIRNTGYLSPVNGR